MNDLGSRLCYSLGHVTSLSLSFPIHQMGIRSFPLQGYYEDYKGYSMRKHLGQGLAHGEPSSMLVVSEGQRCGAFGFK